MQQLKGVLYVIAMLLVMFDCFNFADALWRSIKSDAWARCERTMSHEQILFQGCPLLESKR